MKMNRRVVEYRLVTGSARRRHGEEFSFDANVQAALKEGWQPWGSGSSFATPTRTVSAQPMVKYADEDEPDPTK